MALPIRDGNQSLTTLSTILIGNAHIPAHSVVSLGTQAITDIATAVSGVELGPNTISALEHIAVTFGAGSSITIGNVVSVTGGLTNAELRASSVTIGGSVSVSNLPVTQTVTFTQAPVTFGQAIVSASNINPLLATVGTEGVSDGDNFIKIGGHQDGNNPIAHIVHVSAGGAMKVDASGSSVTFTQASVTFNSITGYVSIQNFPATQTVTFTTATITGSTSILNFPATQTVTFTQASVTFGQASVTFGTPTITGSVSVLNLPATQTVTFTQSSVTFSATTGSVSVLNFPVTQGISGTVTANTDSTSLFTALENYSQNWNDAFPVALKDSAYTTENPFPISGTVTANVGTASEADVTQFGEWIANGFNAAQPTITVIGSSSGQPFPISGTVTANAFGWDNPNGVYAPIPLSDGGGHVVVAVDQAGSGFGSVPISGTVTVGNSITIGASSVTLNSNVAKRDDGTWTNLGVETGSGYVKARVYPSDVTPFTATVTVGNSVTIGNTTTSSAVFTKICGEIAGAGPNEPKEIITDSQGMLYARIAPNTNLTVDPVKYDPVLGDSYINVKPYSGSAVTISNSITIGAVPNGSLTTRFGVPTTAGTAFATSAVTNAGRKYLLIQNVTTGGNVITVGVGFTPTTTQGIQLVAGAGITFESSYIPTGAVYVLSSVTASNFTILEA